MSQGSRRRVLIILCTVEGFVQLLYQNKGCDFDLDYPCLLSFSSSYNDGEQASSAHYMVRAAPNAEEPRHGIVLRSALHIALRNVC